MSAAARQLIESFAALPNAEQHEVLVELLRNTPEPPHEALSDEELIFAADEVFQDLDRHETRA